MKKKENKKIRREKVFTSVREIKSKDE